MSLILIFYAGIQTQKHNLGGFFHVKDNQSYSIHYDLDLCHESQGPAIAPEPRA